MKAIKSMLGAALVALGLSACSTSANFRNPIPERTSPIFSGLCFNVESVVEWWYWETPKGNRYYIVYDDIDQGVDNEVIEVSAEAYSSVVFHADQGIDLLGVLQQGANGLYDIELVD